MRTWRTLCPSTTLWPWKHQTTARGLMCFTCGRPTGGCISSRHRESLSAPRWAEVMSVTDWTQTRTVSMGSCTSSAADLKIQTIHSTVWKNESHPVEMNACLILTLQDDCPHIVCGHKYVYTPVCIHICVLFGLELCFHWLGYCSKWLGYCSSACTVHEAYQ